MYRLFNIVTLLLVQLSVFAAAGPDGGGQQGPTPPGGDPAAQEPASGAFAFNILLMVGVMALMWFVLIRPQSQEKKKRERMISQLKVGAKVVTIGGIHGVIQRVGEQTFDLEIAEDTVIVINRGAVHEPSSDEQKKD
jgi:preprotein translocase subunit YajC